MQPCPSVSSRGLRTITPGLRAAEQWSAVWNGMPDDGSKLELLRMLEDIPASYYGVPSAAWAYLRLIVKKHPETCFKRRSALAGQDLVAAGLAMVSTWTDAIIAEELDRSCRSLARYRSALAGAGLIAFRDSPDRQRYVRGEDRSTPLDAYGVDLRPLVARFDELRDVCRKLKLDRQDARGVRSKISRARNRLRELHAVLASPSDREIAGQALASIDAVRKRKDLDMVRLGLKQATEALSTLESLYDAQTAAIIQLTEESSAPDRTGAQLLPSSLPQIQEKEGLGEGSTPPSEAPERAQLALGVIRAPSPTATAFSEAFSPGAGTDDGFLFEFSLPPSPTLAPITPVERVSCPEVASVLRLLPLLLESKRMEFVRDRRCASDLALVIAYGQASSSRIGLSPAEITRLTRLYGLRFAVAALLTEFSPGVESPRHYLQGILGKLSSHWIKVDLAAGWGRLTRQYLSAEPGSAPSPAPRAPAFASRCVVPL